MKVSVNSRSEVGIRSQRCSLWGQSSSNNSNLSPRWPGQWLFCRGCRPERQRKTTGGKKVERKIRRQLEINDAKEITVLDFIRVLLWENSSASDLTWIALRDQCRRNKEEREGTDVDAGERRRELHLREYSDPGGKVRIQHQSREGRGGGRSFPEEPAVQLH